MGQPNYVEEILQRSIAIHLKKREDYATHPLEDPYENFTRSSMIAAWFPLEYISFGVLIGTKLARLGSLLLQGKTPKNESIDDSFLDLVTYCALFYGYWKSRQSQTLKGIPVIIDPTMSPNQLGLVHPIEKVIDSCNVHDKYEIGCSDCRKINGLE